MDEPYASRLALRFTTKKLIYRVQLKPEAADKKALAIYLLPHDPLWRLSCGRSSRHELTMVMATASGFNWTLVDESKFVQIVTVNSSKSWFFKHQKGGC